MLQERRDAILNAKATFNAAKCAMDDAALATSRCLSTLIEARKLGRFDFHLGLDEIDNMVDLTASLVNSRRRFIEAHPRLAKVGRLAAKGPNNVGDTEGTPNIALGIEENPLRLVSVA